MDMKVNVTGKNENQLLNRTELLFTVDGTNVPPARKELREKLAALQNVKSEQVIVAKISHGFGSKEVVGEARIYKDMESLEKIELKHMIGRNTGQKKKKVKEAAEEAAPEKPAEEAKEEKPGKEGKPAEEGKEKRPEAGETPAKKGKEEKPEEGKAEEQKKGNEKPEKKEGE